MRCVVTGAAGFIGSHLCEDLLRRGHTVVGVDSFVPNYPAVAKAQNQALLLAHPHYHFHALDLRKDDLADTVDEADVVFHLAALSGLPKSWTDFDGYATCNVLGTQRLLDAARATGNLRRFILASSSSVYGRNATGPESNPTFPVSPYGVTKLAAEHLGRSYAEAFNIPFVTLRYFSVYGPRQRPDMACHRFITALIRGTPVDVYGDGRQLRGYTYVGDVVAATVAAVEAPVGEVYNVGGAEAASVLEVIRTLERVSGRTVERTVRPARIGEPRETLADTTKLRNHLGWEPKTRLEDGLARQWQWQTDAQYDLDAPVPIVPTLTRTPSPAARRMTVVGS